MRAAPDPPPLPRGTAGEHSPVPPAERPDPHPLAISAAVPEIPLLKAAMREEMPRWKISATLLAREAQLVPSVVESFAFAGRDRPDHWRPPAAWRERAAQALRRLCVQRGRLYLLRWDPEFRDHLDAIEAAERERVRQEDAILAAALAAGRQA